MSKLPPQPTQSPMQWVSAVLSRWVRWPGHEAEHSPPSHATANNEWKNTSTHTTCPHVGHRNFNFTVHQCVLSEDKHCLYVYVFIFIYKEGQ
jgi:hypothetical protein